MHAWMHASDRLGRLHIRPGSSPPHAAWPQVLRYEPGQFYKTHHDQNAGADSVMGVRLFTFFICASHRWSALVVTHAPRGGWR
jgi:hypothetical protein